MKRREFIAVLSFGIAFPLAVRGQLTKKATRIGFLPLGSSSNDYDRSLVEAFRRGLRRVGLIENVDVVLDIVWITSGADQAVAQVLQRGVDILITCGTSASVAAKKQTWDIPIVFISVGNPVGVGLAESTSRPGQNATGFSDILSELGGKLVGFAQELDRSRASVDYLWHTDWPDGENRFRKTRDAAQSLGLDFRSQGIRDIAEADHAIAKAKEDGAASIIVQPSPFTYRERKGLIDSAMNHGVGAIFAFPIAARDGALIAYGPDYVHMYDRAPFYVDRIIKGTKPADLPIDEVSKLSLVINLKTAKAIGVEIPLPILVGADELVE